MTDGTSQGLFIVVAIVIFGIFVVLAYILFEDTLSPAMASMFTSATEQATDRLGSHYYSEFGLTPTEAKYFEFDSSTGTITNYIGTSKEVVIPHEIGGVKVEVLGAMSFHKKNLTEVHIPNTVKVIAGDEEDHSNGAFRENNLTEVVIPDSVTHIGRDAFYKNKLETVKLSKNLKFLGVGVFNHNNLTEIELPSGIDTIYFATFNHNNLKNVYIPDNVTRIVPESFLYNWNLETISIGKDTVFESPPAGVTIIRR